MPPLKAFCQSGTLGIFGMTKAPIQTAEALLTQPRRTRWDWAAIAMDTAWFSLFLVWLIGRIIGDRNSLVQWISWIPTLGVVAFGCVWLACRAGDRRRHRFRRWGGLACAALTVGAAVRGDFRPLKAHVPASPQDIHIVQWNTDHPSGNDPRSMTALAAISAEHPTDLYLISTRGSITTQECVHQWAGPNFSSAGAGPFACVTTFPIEEARVIAATGKGNDMVWVAKFVLRPPSWNGRALRIAMVDLPSKPTLSRMQVAQELLADIRRGDLGEVDIVAGDFNALPGSLILSRVFPKFHDSWAEAGSGLRASWPRLFPLLSIDHVLLAPDMRAISSITANPGVSKHRMNVVSLRPL
jgi:endonuclease/exonuclease/phosphatase (EEP) superfamily protein YafD